MKKSTKQKLVEKLFKEHKIILDPSKIHSFRRNGFGAPVISWGTVGQKQEYQSFYKMSDCLKLPTVLERRNFGKDLQITIEIDFEKINTGAKGNDE